MRCAKCGNELGAGTLFCPFCGTSVQDAAPENNTPIYRAEVKGLLRSGELIVYRDRVEFVMSQVQKMIFRYDSLVSVKKGLDRINFVMDDGRTESCTVNRKNLHEAFYVIEQAFAPYLAERNRQLQSAGVRYSFPSSPSGLNGVLNNGLLHIMDDRCEYTTPSGKNEVISYQDVKAARISSMGALEFTMYDGTKKAYTVNKELREGISAFFQTALTPFIEERKRQLLAMGIYFSFPNSGKGILNIYGDRLEYSTGTGANDTVAYPDIRAVNVYETNLEAALTDGTTKAFPIDRDFKNEVLAFLNEAIAPYVERRTQGFDLSFGAAEKLEINQERNVFHVIRQEGREITGEYSLADIVKAEMVETKASRDVVGTLFTGRNGEPASRTSDERISDIGVLLTVRTERGMEKLSVCFGNFTFGAKRTSPEYGQRMADQNRFLAYMEEHFPDCELVPLPPIIMLPEALPGDSETEGEAAAQENISQQEPDAVPAGSVERGQFGTLIDGISDFAERCGTPMTVAIQGDWESGDGSFLRMIYDSLKERGLPNVLWLHTWQFAQNDPSAPLSVLLAERLIELLNGTGNAEAKNRAKMLAQGVIGIASGLLSQGSTDGQKLSNALFGDDSANSLEQKVKQFKELVRRKTDSGTGRVIFFVDDLNRLSPERTAELLEALRYFFDCPGCVFMAAVDQERVIQGRRELSRPGQRADDGAAYYDRLFKTAFRVPESSFDVQKYITDNLDRIGIQPESETELQHYGQLAVLSVGSDPKALERLFNSILLLRSVSGENALADKERRLTMFALLCMQTRFPEIYRALVRMSGQITPAFLASLPAGSVLEEQAGLADAEKQAFRTFAGELCSAIDIDRKQGISEQDCSAFVQVLSASVLTSLK